MNFLRVKNWERFQHYQNKEKPPPWIKLYESLLVDYEFLGLSEADRYKLLAIWLLASKTRNKIPDDPAFVARCIGVKKVNLDLFVSRGFLEVVYSESRQTLGTTEQNRVEDIRTEQSESSDHSLVRLLMVLRDSDSQTETVVRSFNPTQGDLEAAKEAATGPNVDSPTKVAVSVLKKRAALRKVEAA